MTTQQRPEIAALSQSPASARRWFITALLGLGVMVSYVDRVNIAVAHDSLSAEFGLSARSFGYLVSAYSWTYALLQIPMGNLLDRIGVKRIQRLATLIWSLATFGASAATTPGAFLGSRLLLGVGEAPLFPASAKAVSQWFSPRQRTLPTAIFDTCAKLASGLGVPLLGVLVVRYGWRISFLATGVLSFLYFLLFCFTFREPREHERPVDPEEEAVQQRALHPLPIGRLLRERKVWGMTIGQFAYCYTFYLLLAWLPGFLSSGLRLSALHAAYFTAIPWIFAAICDFVVGGWLADWLITRGHDPERVRRTILVGGTSMGIAILGVAFTSSPWLIILWISLALGGLAMAAPIGWTVIGMIAPANSIASVGGIMNFGGQAAALAGPILTGYIVDRTHSFKGAFLAAGLIMFAGIWAYIVLLGKITLMKLPEEQS